jgi:D-3-phosphoglycerate dehydrogenase
MAAMFKILTYNQISPAGLDKFPRDRYEVASEMQNPDAILLRSHALHGVPIAPTVKAVGRAGAGVNNIPVAEFSKRGIPVFNAPGANANAVKELVIAGLLLAARNICPAWDFARRLEGDDETLHRLAERGKAQFAGFELAGKTLGVLGLGAIGVRVANTALELGMHVAGFDPLLTVESAWQLSSRVARASSVDDLLGQADMVSLHVPLNEHTRHLINGPRLAGLRAGATLLNFSRAEVVEEAAVLAALDAGRLRAYVSDFPTRRLLDHPKALVLPHLGASTAEAEDHCAAMVVERLRDFLENGNIRHAVNFPDAVLPRTSGTRLGIANDNVPNMVGQITAALAEAGLNIVDLLNKSRGPLAYTLIDLAGAVPAETLDRIRAIEGVLSARVL